VGDDVSDEGVTLRNGFKLSDIKGGGTASEKSRDRRKEEAL
jgi:hypothetical protein